jgi:7,8-dihydroneopterin aldolase/epimerase/oxygenase
MDVVRIIGLELDCIVGIFAFERDREQRLRLDLAMSVDTRKAGRSGRISQTVDYDRVAAQLIAMLRFRRYQLIEMAAEEVCAMLLGTQPELLSVKLTLEKPGALEGRARAASVEVTRTRSDFEFHEKQRGQLIETKILSTRDAQLSSFEVPDGVQWQPPDPPPRARCLWWLCAGRLNQGELVLALGEAQHESAAAEPWLNRSGSRARVFRCVVPGPEQAPEA